MIRCMHYTLGYYFVYSVYTRFRMENMSVCYYDFNFQLTTCPAGSPGHRIHITYSGIPIGLVTGKYSCGGDDDNIFVWGLLKPSCSTRDVKRKNT